MMKNKIHTSILIIILVAGLFIITGCGGGEEKVTTTGAFIGGTQGIVTNFEAFGVEEGNVDTIFDTETFPLEVTLKNKGEYKLKPGDITVKLLGPSQDEFKGVSSWELKNKGEIDIISELLPTGGEETLTFATDAQYTQDVTGLSDREWFANIDYNYQTYLIIPEVCLKEDLNDKRVCEVKESKDFSVSGAPITVKSVEEDTAGKGIIALKIKVNNAKNGKVTKLGEEFGIRDTFSLSIDDSVWECKSGGKVDEVRLIDNEAEIVCKLKNALSEGSLSTKQIKITFDYKYRDIIQKKLRIKESG